jgi:hypothetical protein
MKTSLSNSRKSSGSAVVVVLVLLFMMTVLLTANSLALHRLKQSVQLIEQRQLKKYGVPAHRPLRDQVKYNTSSPFQPSIRATVGM